MDVIDRHFAAENAHDVPGTLATYTDDIVWDDVTHPLSPVHGKDAVGAVYSDIMDAIPDVRLETVRRLEDGSGTFVVDESILTGMSTERGRASRARARRCASGSCMCST